MYSLKIFVLKLMIMVHVYGMENISNYFSSEKEYELFRRYVFSTSNKKYEDFERINENYRLKIMKDLTQKEVNEIIDLSWDEHAVYKVLCYGFNKKEIPGFIVFIKAPTINFCFLDDIE
jgi:hypothetical protein